MASVCRVTGPIYEGGKFRLVVFMPERKSLWCKSREEADALKAQIETYDRRSWVAHRRRSARLSI